jgi:hypothetical protein
MLLYGTRHAGIQKKGNGTDTDQSACMQHSGDHHQAGEYRNPILDAMLLVNISGGCMRHLMCAVL